MIIEFSDLLSRKERKKAINFTFDFPNMKYDGDEIVATKEVVVEGQVTSTENVLTLNAKVSTALQLSCSRCLETFIYPIDIDIEERYTNNPEFHESEEVIYVDGDSLDITEIIQSEIISSLPIKRLCKESCKGLCTTCGKNLNLGTCQCDDFDVDLRLAKLKDFFANKEV